MSQKPRITMDVTFSLGNDLRRRPSDSQSLYVHFFALFLVIVGVRLALVSIHASALPILDQWDGEAASTFKPWMDGTLSISDLFRPHNEHRIVLSRLLALALLRLNGQWDSLLELAANALISGLIAIAISAGLIQLLGNRHRIAVLVAVMLWFSLPYGQENTLSGFQSSFYFLLFFSLLAIWGLTFQTAFSFRWWLGATGAVLACFSMASGFFAAAATLGIVFVRAIKIRRVTRDVIVTAIFTAAVVATSLFFRVSVPGHQPLQAASPIAWLIVFSRCLAWPFCEMPAAALIIYLPAALLALHYFKRQEDSSTASRRGSIELLLAAAGWVALQSAAIALTRGGDGRGLPASRYMDILAFGTLVNFCAAMLLLFGHVRRPFWERAAFTIWTLLVLVGSAYLSYRQITPQSGRKAYLQLMEQNVAGYVATGDHNYLDQPIPYPQASRLAMLLDDPSIRRILPAVIREPLRIEMKSGGNAGFISNGYPPEVRNPQYERVWGSFTKLGAAARGSMESQPFTSHFHYLQFDIAGYLRSGLSLAIRGERSNTARRFVPVDRVDSYWRRGYVAAPDKAARILATDDNAAEWFAFREPRELARFSYYALRLIARGKLVLLAGIFAWMAVCFNHLRPRLIDRDRRGSGA